MDSMDTEKQAVSMLGLKIESIEKTDARKDLSNWIGTTDLNVSIVRITEDNKPVAVLISHEHWLALMMKLCASEKELVGPRPLDMIGSIQINGELQAASEDAATVFDRAIKESSDNL